MSNARTRPFLCYKCGGIMKKTCDNPESYRCECGYTIRRVNRKEHENRLLAFIEAIGDNN